MLRHAFVALIALAACEKSTTSSKAPPVGDFPDNPLLATVPADTPYVFATFKPIPADYVDEMKKTFGPIWRRAFDTYMQKDAAGAEAAKVIFDEIGDLDAKRLDELGISTDARFVIYGLPNGYPVMHVELASGDRLLAFLQRIGGRLHEALPTPTQRGAYRLWRSSGKDGWTGAIALGAKDLVIAFAKDPALDENLATILGEKKPSNALTTKAMHEIAVRDGFGAQGVGYIDFAHTAALIPMQACGDAVRTLAHSVPRLAVGYRDLSAHHTSAGLVFELAPEVVKQLRGVSGTLAGLDRVLAAKPAMAIAVAGDLEHARALIPAVATAISDLGERCESPELADAGRKAGEFATKPLPPYVAGLHGGAFAIEDVQMSGGVPQKLDGFAVVRSDHAADLVKELMKNMPGADLPLDGKAHQLSTPLPFPVNAAATQDAIAFAVGQNGASRVVEVLGGKPAPAPLATLVFDYRRLGDLIPLDPSDPDSANTKALMKALGVLTFELTVDDRGLVLWMAFGRT